MKSKQTILTGILILVKDKDLAEELFSQTIFKIADALDRGVYKDNGQEVAWAKQVARNICIDHFRMIKRSIKTINQDLPENYIFKTDADDFHFIQREEDRQNEIAISKYLSILPEDQREVVVLRYYGKLSYREISQITNTNLNTSLGRMRYALHNIRQKINSQKPLKV